MWMSVVLSLENSIFASEARAMVSVWLPLVAVRLPSANWKVRLEAVMLWVVPSVRVNTR